jgi:hypothetical protein
MGPPTAASPALVPDDADGFAFLADPRGKWTTCRGLWGG